MKAIWSPRGKVRKERELWIAVMKAQRDLGIDIPEEAISAYEAVRDEIDLDSIAMRERITRHDVKARIDEYCELAGYEQIHKGMTSRDLTENVEGLQVFEALRLVRGKLCAVPALLAEKAREYRNMTITARTHNVAAQPTTLGKRWAMFGQELLLAWRRIDACLERFAVRGLKGAVGTQMDLLTLLEGDSEKTTVLEERVAAHLGVPHLLPVVGQVYPRSLDYEVLGCLVQAGAGMSSFATTLRLMAGYEIAAEGFAKGQTGSSAMPHKMNSRSCERICGFQKILTGFQTMVAGLAGDQWHEGDVSCSVVRRVALPGGFFALDGMIETMLTILVQMEVNPAVIERENSRYMPFLATTTILMEAVKAGAGREEAHEAIKEHAVSVVRDLREGRIESNDLAERVARDERVGLSLDQITRIIDGADRLVGLAGEQVDRFAAEVSEITARFPEESKYRPGSIL